MIGKFSKVIDSFFAPAACCWGTPHYSLWPASYVLIAYPYHPCMINLPIYIWLIFMVHVGTVNIPYMDPMGYVCMDEDSHYMCSLREGEGKSRDL